MDVGKHTREIYFFRNTCHRCFNDVEIPSLGDFAYGELIFQTTNAQDFALVTLIDNKTFSFIINALETLKNKKTDPQYVLARLADPLNGKEFTIDRLCPICRHKQRHFVDYIKTSSKKLPFVSWNSFEDLNEENKIQLIKEIVSNKI